MIRANAARYPISARCGIPGVPRSTCYWMTGHPGTERADPIAGDVRAVRRDGRERHGARKIKAALERKGVTASRRRIGNIMREQGMTSAYARGRSEPHRTRADEARLANLPAPRVRRLRPAHASGGRSYLCPRRRRLGVRVWTGNGVLDRFLEDESLFGEFLRTPVSEGGVESLVVEPPHIVVEVGA